MILKDIQQSKQGSPEDLHSQFNKKCYSDAFTNKMTAQLDAFSDVQFQVGQKFIAANTKILKARSSYFHAMFSSSFREANEKRLV